MKAVTAIITADVVNFTLLDFVTEKKMISLLTNVVADNKVEFYRGDSFQVNVKDPGMALEIVFRLRAAARSIHPSCDVRASIGIGKANTHIRTLKIASGQAFILSGRSFDDLETEERLLIRSENQLANVAFNLISYFADYFLQRLTNKQAEVVLQLLSNQTQVQAAKKLKKTQPTINQLAKSAGWPEIRKLIEGYGQVIAQFDIV